MPHVGSVDRFDSVRRAWIAQHQGWSTIQRRRAERLGRRIRARQREHASAVPDPHDDTSLPPVWLRTAQSPASHVEVTLLGAVLVMVPLGVVGGYAIKAAVTRLIPDTLRGYPVVALAAAAVALGALTVALGVTVHHPGGSLREAVLAPWVCVQISAVPAAAGVLGLAEGWLAVPASRRWFPLTPTEPALTSAEAVEILGGYDVTGPGLLEAKRLEWPGERTR